jgi:hypothetical protein
MEIQKGKRGPWHIITIRDEEDLDSAKEASLDVILNRYRDSIFDSWGQRFVNVDNVQYQINDTVWDNKEFQQDFLVMLLKT